MMESPLINIITVCRNAEKVLTQTIENVLSLDYANIEYIIIDGGSTDGTIDVIKKYTSRLKYWKSEPDDGIYDAMNKGWTQATSNSYVLYLGAGDLILSLPNVNNFKADVIAGEVQIGKKYIYKPKKDVRLKLGNTLHHQALLIKKNICPNNPFNTDFKTYADFDFNQRILKSSVKIEIDYGLKAYALEGGISTKFNKVESLQIVRKNFGWFYFKLAQLYYLLRHEV